MEKENVVILDDRPLVANAPIGQAGSPRAGEAPWSRKDTVSILVFSVLRTS